jgi:aldehyde:ferredoxin oxidoreductase
VDAQTPKAKADFTMLFQDLMETISASGQCLFTSYAFFPGFLLTNPNGVITQTVNKVATHIGPAVRFINKCPRIAALHLPVFHHTKMIKLATGMYMDFGKYLSIGERGYTLERHINSKFGISAANDKLPKRLTDVPQDPASFSKLMTALIAIEEAQMLDMVTVSKTAVESVPGDAVSAHLQEGEEWAVLPISAVDSYYGNNNFSKKWKPFLPKNIAEFKNSYGICKYKINL